MYNGGSKSRKPPLGVPNQIPPQMQNSIRHAMGGGNQGAQTQPLNFRQGFGNQANQSNSFGG